MTRKDLDDDPVSERRERFGRPCQRHRARLFGGGADDEARLHRVGDDGGGILRVDPAARRTGERRPIRSRASRNPSKASTLDLVDSLAGIARASQNSSHCQR